MSAQNLQQTLDAAADPLAALLAQVAEGRRDAFESLYRQTSATMLGICLRVLLGSAITLFGTSTSLYISAKKEAA